MTATLADTGESQSKTKGNKSKRSDRQKKGAVKSQKDKDKVVALRLEFEKGKLPPVTLRIAVKLQVQLKPAVQTNGRIDFATTYLGKA